MPASGAKARARRLARQAAAGGAGSGPTPSRRGVVKVGPYMTRDAARRLRLAKAAARQALSEGKSLAEAAAIARTFAVVSESGNSDVSSDSDEHEGSSSSVPPQTIEEAMAALTFSIENDR